MRVVSAVGLDPVIGVGGGGWDNSNRKRDGRLEATAAVAKAARAVGIAPKNAMRTVRRTLQHIRKGARVEESAPPPGARQPGSGRKELLKPWMLELATKQAKKWRGYFSLDDMWEFLRQRCMDEGWDLDFSRRTVGRAMQRNGWNKFRQRIKPHLTRQQKENRVEFCKRVLNE